MRRTHSLLALPAVVALALAGCSSSDSNSSGTTTSAATDQTTTTQAAAEAFPVTVTHSAGETTIESQPENVAVLDFGALDTLDTLGFEGVTALPRSSTVPSFLSDYDSDDYTDLGTIMEPDTETIATVEPDLVITGGRTSSMYDDLSQNFTTVDATLDYSDYVEGVKRDIEIVAESVGMGDQAAELTTVIDDKVSEVQQAAEDAGVEGKTGVFLLVTGGNVSAFGPGSRFGYVYDLTGVDYALSDADTEQADENHGAEVSFETIAQANPDYIWVLDRDAVVGSRDGGEVTSAQEVLNNDFVNGTSAAQNDKITYVTPERWYLVMQGASNFPAMLDEISASL